MLRREAKITHKGDEKALDSALRIIDFQLEDALWDVDDLEKKQAEKTEKGERLPEDLEKALPPGTIHTWANGQQYKKQPDGTWEPVRQLPTPPERTGAVKLDQEQLRAVVDRWLDKQKWSRVGVLAAKQLEAHDEHIEIEAADGKRRKVHVLISPRPDVKDPRGVNGEQRRMGTSHADDFIKVSVRQQPWERDELGAEVRSVLSHELTHAADPAPKRHGPKTADDATSRYRAYLNLPEEVTARLHQVMRELEDKRVATHYYHTRNPRPDADLLAYSPTWKSIEQHLTPENRRRFLRLAAQVATRIRSGPTPTFEKAADGSGSAAAGLFEHRTEVGTMGNHGAPARRPGANTSTSHNLPAGHPASPEAREKLRRRRGKREEELAAEAVQAKRAKVDSALALQAPVQVVPIERPKLEVDRHAEDQMARMELEAERKAKRLHMGRLTINPRELRR
jgi:hypothetical protein